MLSDILKEIEQMSAEEKQQLLDTKFPDEVEKLAEAQIAESELVDALYAYGWLAAERQLAEVDGLDKIAAESLQQHEEAVEEVGNAVEQLVSDLGLAEIEDSAEMHKVAQAASVAMFSGYSDFFEKLAVDTTNAPPVRSGGSMASKIKASARGVHTKGRRAGMKMTEFGHEVLKKHKGKAALIAAGLGAAGYGAHHLMKKKASEATLGEMVEAMRGPQEVIDVVEEGLEKLANAGAKKGLSLLEKLKAHPHTAKVKEHLGKYQGLYGGAAGAGAGFAAGRASKG